MTDLAAAFDADGLTCFVGAGGKKTTMYALANATERAVVTATVRIPIFDPHVAHVEVTEDPISTLITTDEFPLGLVPEQEFEDRYRGYDPDTVTDLARSHDGPVLVKADGARMRDFKAPGVNEPRIPETADTVVPIASAHAVGEPLDEEMVHRPERVADVAGVDVGDEITPEVVGRTLASPDGGLRGVPAGATAVPLVNKVDDDEDLEVAREIADTILEHADRSVVPRVVLARMGEAEIREIRE
ncbi:selenium cofactor biosynthesis protein YqeC [Halolamina salifodinae]|uniref:Putative selenium-dependent hydroxylase accessory protein YqeC n=1 Tax=Halolamina salifodinae TaxID=1202767 RepID=A0A8T4H3F1_9EURY|nr:selenium cofactor biosynthesis protein YqeC [Halolamina salifodinae]MBP1987718.1 putative selenium-dependent hydroxylase accessory protein YqeC [Halolamina salifodinae]